MPGLSVNILGTGNVAWHLAHALFAEGLTVMSVAGRNMNQVEELSRAVNAQAVLWPNALPQADITLLAVSDRAVAEVSANLPPETLRAHTSGSVPMDALGAGRTAVWYPLQTFSKSKDVDWTGIPLCIEARQTQDLEILRTLGEALDMDVREVNSRQREVLHLAAVFACNFPNVLYQISEELLEQGEMDLDLLRPLIQETTEKVLEQSPREAQTGPARRNDQPVLNRHRSALEDHPEWKSIYEQLSQLILQRYHGSEL